MRQTANRTDSIASAAHQLDLRSHPFEHPLEQRLLLGHRQQLRQPRVKIGALAMVVVGEEIDQLALTIQRLDPSLTRRPSPDTILQPDFRPRDGGPTPCYA